jgi:hypothetical protein
MAQKVVVSVLDDLDGSAEASTVKFGLDGVSYEIDLSEANAERLRALLASYVENGRRVFAGSSTVKRGRGTTRRRSPATSAAAEEPAALVPAFSAGDGGSGNGEVTDKDIKAWAVGKGLIEATKRGRLPQAIRDQYSAAHGW